MVNLDGMDAPPPFSMLWEMLKLQHGHFLSGGKVSERRREGEEETSGPPPPLFPIPSQLLVLFINILFVIALDWFCFCVCICGEVCGDISVQACMNRYPRHG